MTMPPAFPFTALVGQEALQQALLLVAVDPGIGGLLISGPRGTAKSTSARALAAVLPTHRFINLPLGASEAQLTGTLDIERMLRDGEVHFNPGLLAKAHGGVLYVDEVNLLSDVLVDPLLDVSSSGVNVIERDGVSHTHAARFVLIGTMNPEEGELRPQLSDRFGLAVVLENCLDVVMRERIVKTRLAFDLDAERFCAHYADAEAALAQRVMAARDRLNDLPFSDTVHRTVSQRCLDAGVDGLRADLVMLKAARALAALEGARAIETGHVARVAELVLLHRRTIGDAHDVRAGAGENVVENAGENDGERGTAEAAKARERAGPEAFTHEAYDTRANGHHSSASGDAGSPLSADPEPFSNHARSRPDPNADWGHLPAEPVPTLAAKKLRPFNPKKA